MHMACAVPASFVHAFQFKKCKQMDQKNIVKCVEHRRSLNEIFEDEHGALPKLRGQIWELNVPSGPISVHRMKNSRVVSTALEK